MDLKRIRWINGIIISSVWYLTVIVALTPFFEKRMDENLAYLVVSAINILGLIFLVYALKQQTIFMFSCRSFFKGLIVAGPFSAFILYSIIAGVTAGISDYGKLSMNNYEFLVWLTGYFLGAGLCEEILTRGLFFNIFTRLFGNNKRGLRLSVVISSILFGVFHFMSIFDGNSLLDVCGQIVYSVGFGILLAAIYIRVRNIWLNSFLHFLYDIGQTIYYECFNFNEESDFVQTTDYSYLLIYIAVFLITTILGAYLIRDKKLEESIVAFS